MRRNLKRGLATLLSAMMVITAAPATSVFAVESQQQEGWSDDGYYYYFDEDGETLLEEKGKPTEVAATCSENAKTIYTSEHGGEFTVEKPDTKLAHTPAKAVKENETPATCTEEGKYEEVVYCDVCGEEISREEKKSDALGHVALDPVEEKNAKTESPLRMLTTGSRKKSRRSRYAVNLMAKNSGNAPSAVRPRQEQLKQLRHTQRLTRFRKM